MKNFESWTYEEVEDTFGITQVSTSYLFEEWKNVQNNLSTTEIEVLNFHKQHLLERVEAWNEDELKMFFIGPIITMANLDTPDFKAFTQRSFSANIQGIEVAGKVDFMLAKGKQKPKNPFFCLHEYKQENRRDNDPRGQLLIAMVTAKHLNNNELPIFGAYVSGRNWFFVLLQNQEYAVSDAYVATQNDIFEIVLMLRKSVALIQQSLANLSHK